MFLILLREASVKARSVCVNVPPAAEGYKQRYRLGCVCSEKQSPGAVRSASQREHGWGLSRLRSKVGQADRGFIQR